MGALQKGYAQKEESTGIRLFVSYSWMAHPGSSRMLSLVSKFANAVQYGVTLENWLANYEGEIQRALEARASGNEGKARVCARRAAGMVIGEYLNRHHIPFPASVIKRLETFRNLPGIPAQIQEVVGHLLEHVDQEYNLPASIDLIAETQWLIRALRLEADNLDSTR